MKVKTAIKTAGLSFAGYALASMFADKIPLNPMVSQVAGFVGAFLGTLAAPRRDRRRSENLAAARNGASGAAASPAAGEPPRLPAGLPANNRSKQAEAGRPTGT